MTARVIPLMANVVQVSWKKALRVFDARLANAPPEHGTKLRHWKETVAEVHSDFEAKLPGTGPGTLTLRAEQVDGRTEESRYPNLMIPGVMQQYMWSIADTSTEGTSMYRYYWEGRDPFQYLYPHPPGHPP